MTDALAADLWSVAGDDAGTGDDAGALATETAVSGAVVEDAGERFTTNATPTTSASTAMLTVTSAAGLVLRTATTTVESSRLPHGGDGCATSGGAAASAGVAASATGATYAGATGSRGGAISGGGASAIGRAAGSAGGGWPAGPGSAGGGRDCART